VVLVAPAQSGPVSAPFTDSSAESSDAGISTLQPFLFHLQIHIRRLREIQIDFLCISVAGDNCVASRGKIGDAKSPVRAGTCMKTPLAEGIDLGRSRVGRNDYSRMRHRDLIGIAHYPTDCRGARRNHEVHCGLFSLYQDRRVVNRLAAIGRRSHSITPG